MKLQTLALGLALAVAGSAFAATHETTVVRETPNGTVTRHIVRTNERQDIHHRHHRHHMRHVVVVHHPNHRYDKKVVVVHPAHHGRDEVNRTVVVHRG